MKTRLFILQVLCLAILPAFTQELVWQDEFEGTGIPDNSKWERQEYNRRNNANGPDGWWSNEDSYLDGNGNLVIRVRKIENKNNDSDPYDYSVGMVRSKGKFEQLYGRFETRCKLPTQQGWWVAFWMMQGNVGSVGNGGLDGMEVDIMEAWGWTNRINHAFHWDGYGIEHQVLGKDTTIAGLLEGYHTYTLDWYPDRYVFYIDDVETWRSVGGGVCQSPGYVKVTGEISTEDWAIGHWWSKDPAQAEYPDSFLVDYVRVYDFNMDENDSVAPSKPSNLKVEPKSNLANASWDIANDNYAVKLYKVLLDSTLIDTTYTNKVKIENLEINTEYHLGIVATDYSGNDSDTAYINFTTIEQTPIEIPGRIQAEEFYTMEGIETESCSDAGGGENIGWIEQGDWLSYKVDVKQAGEYEAHCRIAGEADGSFEIKDEDGNILTTVNIPKTGAWQTWKTIISDKFSLSKGEQMLKIESKSAGYNINWVEILKPSVNTINKADLNFSLYPNPIEDLLYINCELQNYSIDIYSLLGNRVYSLKDASNNQVVTLSHLPGGIYLLKMQYQGIEISKKLIID